jgi:hypothetical protein
VTGTRPPGARVMSSIAMVTLSLAAGVQFSLNRSLLKASSYRVWVIAPPKSFIYSQKNIKKFLAEKDLTKD